ncbi:hypothetical protein QE152_g24846 [Popillia japonica]|uniref:Uncharacterized protein n=1 Tax=Popillia japonica TaxID=7064 RepID=A0AAW1K216_POPJA
MTPTLHKILIHGSIVVEKALLTIGLLSEEAAEARNKHFRSYRMNYARNFSRESCNLDVIHRLLLTSDPLITGMRPIPRKKSKPFLRETVDMFLTTDLERDPSQDSPSNDSDSSDNSGDESEDSFDEETITPASADIK